MPRKAIQISVATGYEDCKPFLTVLCDDGTIWDNAYDLDKEAYEGWCLVPDIPQDSLESLNLGEAQCLHCGLMKRNKYAACGSCGSKHNK